MFYQNQKYKTKQKEKFKQINEYKVFEVFRKNLLFSDIFKIYCTYEIFQLTCVLLFNLLHTAKATSFNALQRPSLKRTEWEE